MNVIEKLTSPSIGRSIVYPVLAAGSMYLSFLGFTATNNERNDLASQYRAAIQSNTNLARIVDIRDHIKITRVNDVVTKQLQAEKENLLADSETRKSYEFIDDLGKKIRAYDYIKFGKDFFSGMTAAAFGLIGLHTILNTIADQRKRKQQQNA